MRTIILDRRDGVFVGQAMGFAFFSLLDTAGQSEVVTFVDSEDAKSFMAEFDPPYPGDVEFIDLDIETVTADVTDLCRAGLDAYLGDLLANTAPAASC